MKRFMRYLLFYTLLGANFGFGMNSTSTQNVDDDGDQKSNAFESDDELFKHLKRPKMGSSLNNTNLVYPHQLSDDLKKKFEAYFNDLPHELKKNILAFKKAHGLDKNTDFLTNILIFAGEPGTGKSDGAKAIAYKLGWPYLFIDCSSLGNTYQNSAIVHLRETTQPVIKANKPCVIILDEISNVSKQAKDVRDENPEVHKIRHEINALLDEIQNRKNVLLIGTTNHINVISDAICSRSDIVFFKPLTPDQKIDKFKSLLLSFNAKLRLLETTWDILKNRISNYDLRDIQRLVSQSYTNAWTRCGYANGTLRTIDEDVLSAIRKTSANKAMLAEAKTEKSEQQKIHEDAKSHSEELQDNQFEFEKTMADRSEKFSRELAKKQETLSRELTQNQINAGTAHTFLSVWLNKCNLL